MRRALLALAAALAALLSPASAAPESDEPVQLSVKLPAVVASGIGFPLTVTVTVDPGALDAATSPLRIRVRAAGECGSSFEATPGAALMDRPLPPGGRLSAKVFTHSFGEFTACAFLEQTSDARLFAFDDASSFAVTHPCTTFTRRAITTRRALIKTRKALRHAHGGHRAALQRRVARLHARLRRANAGRKRSCRT